MNAKPMKTQHILLILVTAFLFSSCVPRPPVRLEVEPGDELLARAEKLFMEKSYAESFALYYEYISTYAERPMAANALSKMGAIYEEQENHLKAREIYQRIVDEYPDSPLVSDAMVQILETLYREGRHEDVVKQAGDTLKKAVSDFHVFKTYGFLGDSQMKIGSPADAFYSYAMAYERAEAPEKERLIPKLKASSEPLNTSETLSLLERIEVEAPVSYLLYHLGMGYLKEKKYADAEKTLSEFVDRFPEHENASMAKDTVNEITKNFLFDHDTIGCLLPLSGLYKTYGYRVLKGIELALNHFSALQLNPPVKIVIKDTESDPAKSAFAAEELFHDRVAAIIGPIVTVEPAASAAQNRGIPIITLTQKENVTDIGEFVFRNFLTPKMQVRTILSYATEELGLNNFAILYPNEKYGTTFMNLFWDEVIAYGGKVVGVEAYDTGLTDFADSIKKLVGLYYEIPEDIKNLESILSHETYDYIDYESVNLDEESEGLDEEEDVGGDEEAEPDPDEEPQAIVDFDGIFIPDSAKKSGLIIPQLAFYDVKDVYLFGTNLWHSSQLIQMADQYVQGAVMVDGFFPGSEYDYVKEFTGTFLETYNETPGFIEAVAYDTAMILFQIVGRPNIQSRSAIREELLRLGNYPGVTGITAFDTNGESRKKLFLLRVKGERFVEIKNTRME